MASSAGGEGEPEFQIAPMLDVMLVLLIFFMSITATAVSRYDPAIQVPVAPDANKKEDSQSELVFNIAWKPDAHAAQITYEEEPVNFEAVIPRLARHLKADPKVRVLIRADNETPVSYINQVIEAAAKAGIVDITFATMNR
ncbi:ExbD/TolR family protein [Geminisphaera colitermitum]|uniref:ExbD/TolR family protein n=1 Tax=Geminisphaera colitermitum TaxID=1148786 RepID=UPI000158C6A6|nr:biopolymer transporter ExbD [Geminisphaera colitermitum]